MENTIKIQILKLIQLKTIISEVKNILDDINGRLDVVGVDRVACRIFIVEKVLHRKSVGLGSDSGPVRN